MVCDRVCLRVVFWCGVVRRQYCETGSISAREFQCGALNVFVSDGGVVEESAGGRSGI